MEENLSERLALSVLSNFRNSVCFIRREDPRLSSQKTTPVLVLCQLNSVDNPKLLFRKILFNLILTYVIITSIELYPMSEAKLPSSKSSEVRLL